MSKLERTTIPFNYAWRFHYGDDPSSPPGSGPGTAIFPDRLRNYSKCKVSIYVIFEIAHMPRHLLHL